MTEGPTQEQLEAGRLLFAGECTFVLGVADVKQLPVGNMPELALVGRSNVGKSSLVNALTGRTSLARTSHTPGHTRQLNFFDIGGRFHLVDMPGYGFAKASKSMVSQWQAVIVDYLRGRVQLKRLLLLIDGRHGVKENDIEMMEFLDSMAVVYQVVLTKADHLSREQQQAVVRKTQELLKKHAAAFPEPALTSSREGWGVGELRAECLAALMA